MKYDKLLQLVAENPILQNDVKDIISTHSEEILNLVRPDWQEILNDSALYQKYRDSQVKFSTPKRYVHIELQKIIDPDDIFHVLIFGYFTVYKSAVDKNGQSNIFFASKECPPITEISNILTTTVNDCELNPYGKFNVESCGYVSCRYCPKFATKYNIKLDFPWWCVRNTKIFNGENTKNVFRNTMEKDLLNAPFLAILNLKINTRQFYGNNFKNVKIGGTIKNMILFKEQSLEPKLDMDEKFFFDDRFFIHAPNDSNSIDNTCTFNNSNAGSNFSFNEKDSKEEYLFIKKSPTEFTSFIPIESSPSLLENGGNDEEEEGELNPVDCIPSSHLENGSEDDGNEFQVQYAKRIKLI